MTKNNLWARAFFALLLTITLVALGFILFRAGVAFGSSEIAVTTPIAVGPFGALFLAVFGFILFFFALKLIFGALLFPVMGMRRWRGYRHPRFKRMWMPGKWDADNRDFIKEWHRRLHEEEDRGQVQEEVSA